ncbi:MAG: HEAT repeat domain-containing protein [Chloroflexia bacterium]|nr:HEAT repeat domain-containing protein [Chloroflexia bacterium]
MDEQSLAQRIAELEHQEEQVRWAALQQLAQAADQGAVLQEAIPALARTLADAHPNIRQQAAYTLVSISEHGGDIAPALPALAQALGDESEGVRKEAVWALYCLAYVGADLAPAVAALEGAMADPSRSVRGNGAIALCLHYLRSGQESKAQELLAADDGNLIFGAAWAHVDFYRQAQDKAGLQALYKQVRPGLLDLGLSNGIAGALSWARDRGEDISFALAALQELLAQAQDDALAQAPLYGILMKLNRS